MRRCAYRRPWGYAGDCHRTGILQMPAHGEARICSEDALDQLKTMPVLHGDAFFQGRWKECVCIASGPSLRAEDCAAVRAWVDRHPDRGVIVVNTTFRLCPWANVLYAMDHAWWQWHLQEARARFLGALVAPGRLPGVHHVPVEGVGHSGAGAVALAARWGAAKIVLLGYDCQKSGGKAHWHEDHPRGLGNAAALPGWPADFKRLLPMLSGIQVINATRETALDVFPRMNLKEVLDT